MEKKKTVLKVYKNKFINFMLDQDDGFTTSDIKKLLKKKGSFTLEDIVKDCGYIPSDVIKSKVSKKMMSEDYGNGDFEVEPSDFTIKFV